MTLRPPWPLRPAPRPRPCSRLLHPWPASACHEAAAAVPTPSLARALHRACRPRVRCLRCRARCGCIRAFQRCAEGACMRMVQWLEDAPISLAGRPRGRAAPCSGGGGGARGRGLPARALQAHGRRTGRQRPRATAVSSYSRRAGCLQRCGAAACSRSACLRHACKAQHASTCIPTTAPGLPPLAVHAPCASR